MNALPIDDTSTANGIAPAGENAMTEMMTAALTTPTARPTRRVRRLARLSAVLAGVLVSTVAMTGTASAANYDNPYGDLQTASGARGTVLANCGTSNSYLDYNFSGNLFLAPHYWRFAQRRVGGSWSSWFGWYSTSDRAGSVPLWRSGDWQFVVQIAYSNGRAWEYDSEFALHRNMERTASGWAYVIRASCHIS